MSYRSNSEVLSVRWLNVPFHDGTADTDFGPRVSFQVDMRPDGTIDIHLFEIHDPNTLASVGVDSEYRPWLAGAIRYDYTASSDTGLDYTTLPSLPPSGDRVVYSRQSLSWGTSRSGAYLFQHTSSLPPVTDREHFTSAFVAQSTQRIRYCTVGVNWCMAPTTGSIAGGMNLTLITSDMTCFAPSTSATTTGRTAHHAECRFYPCDINLSTNDTSCHVASSSSFLSTPASYSSLSGSLTCPLPSGDMFSPPRTFESGSNMVEVRIFDIEAQVEIGMMRTIVFTYLEEVTSISRDYEANDANIRMNQLGLYPLLCDECGYVNAPVCERDCAGVYSGSAVLDDCGVCVGGTTNHTFNGDMNCAGICFVSSFITTTNTTSDRTYCACSNTNATDATQAYINYGLPYPPHILAMLEEFDCPIEEVKDMLGSLEDVRYYKFGLLLLSGIGMIFVLIYTYAKHVDHTSNDDDDGDVDSADEDDDDGSGIAANGDSVGSIEYHTVATSSPQLPTVSNLRRTNMRAHQQAFTHEGRYVSGSSSNSPAPAIRSMSSHSSYSMASPSSTFVALPLHGVGAVVRPTTPVSHTHAQPHYHAAAAHPYRQQQSHHQHPHYQHHGHFRSHTSSTVIAETSTSTQRNGTHPLPTANPTSTRSQPMRYRTNL